MKKRKAFTLIELIAVLVILAILALIVTPLVLNIIRKASIAADRRSVDAYGRSVELAIASYTMDTGYPPTNLDNLEVEYTGKTVVCRVKQLKENGGLYMTQCSVNGKEVKDSSTDDGYYHYGTRDLTNEEFIDMYGDALKKASLKYLEDNGSIVSDYKTLNIDYKGKEVSCEVTINNDGTIYMENCTVAGTQVENKTYGEIKYAQYSERSILWYNNEKYYVLEDSGINESTVTLLKADPLTYEEVQTYSAGTGASISQNGYGGRGGMAYGSSSSYDTSYIKVTVDAWAAVKVPRGLKEARLITVNEITNLGFEWGMVDPSTEGWVKTENTPSWIYNSNYSYWTMSPLNDSNEYVWIMGKEGRLGNGVGILSVVRPVIVLSKTVL